MSEIPRCSRCGMPALEGPLRVINATITQQDDDTIFEGQLVCDECMKRPEPSQVACDFCGESEPEWMYDANPFGVLLTDGDKVANFSFDDEHWLACSACRVLLDDHDATALINRIIALYGAPFPSEEMPAFKHALGVYFDLVMQMLVHPAKEVMNT